MENDFPKIDKFKLGIALIVNEYISKDIFTRTTNYPSGHGQPTILVKYAYVSIHQNYTGITIYFRFKAN